MLSSPMRMSISVSPDETVPVGSLHGAKVGSLMPRLFCAASTVTFCCESSDLDAYDTR